MNWENSRALTPLKRDFLKVFFAHEKRFFLTGGSALGLFYLDHRFSYDLDLFSQDRPDWLELDGVMRLCAQDIEATLELKRDAPTFRRYQLVRGDDNEIVDIVLDISPQIDPEKTWIDNIRVDTLHEIVVNKITTLISRCELKDIVDLYFLEKAGYRIDDYFEEARQKDGGLDPAMVSLLLDSLRITEVPDYMIKPLTLSELCSFIDELKRRMALKAFPENV
jgi:hypothetical protein